MVVVGQTGLKTGNAVRVVALETRPASQLRAASAERVAAGAQAANR